MQHSVLNTTQAASITTALMFAILQHPLATTLLETDVQQVQLMNITRPLTIYVVTRTSFILLPAIYTPTMSSDRFMSHLK
jgi:hypothetical protein